MHSVFNSCYPTLVEPRPPLRSSSLPSNLSSSSFEIPNLQPTQKIQHSIPTLPYSKQTLSFLHNFKFQYPDSTNEEYLKNCRILVKYQSGYATHRNYVGQISTPLRIRLKPNAKLQTQRPIEVPIHYREKLTNLLQELEKQNVNQQIGSNPSETPYCGPTFLNLLIIIPEGDTMKVVSHAHHLNSKTDQAYESWSIEPLPPQLPRAKKVKSAIHPM